MQRRADGWHLEIVAFGARADERVAAVGGGVAELRQVPRVGDCWQRREFGISLDSKRGHEHLPIVIAIHAYVSANPDFVPDLSNTDALLFSESGDAARDARLVELADAALASRLGNPPRIVERAAGDLKNQVKSIVKRTVQALKAGELTEFWKLSDSRAEAAHDEEVFGPLTKEVILRQREGELVAFLLRVVHERGLRAVRAGRLATTDAYDRCLGVKWQRLLAVSALESLVSDSGMTALFCAREARAMEREDVTSAIALLKRIGASKKAGIVERALLVAREANLWEGNNDATASKVLEELSERFYAVDDEPLRAQLEAHIRKAPEEFTLSAYED